MPRVFIQHQPLGTAGLLSEMKVRGIDGDLATLRELHRSSLPVSFVYVSDRQVGDLPAPAAEEPRSGGTLQDRLRFARDRAG